MLVPHAPETVSFTELHQSRLGVVEFESDPFLGLLELLDQVQETGRLGGGQVNLDTARLTDLQEIAHRRTGLVSEPQKDLIGRHRNLGNPPMD